MERRIAVLVLSVSLFGGALAGCTGPAPQAAQAPSPALLATQMLAHPPGVGVQPTGQTKVFNLYLHKMTHEVYPGATMQMWGFSLSDDPTTATVPGPELRVQEGDLVVVNFLSTVDGFDHTLHWHGQNVPYHQDGVPYVTQDPIPSGQDYTYSFIANPAGTYWYHCHVDSQHHIDMGMYGALIVEPQDPAQDPPFDREATLFLDEMDRFHLESGQPATGNLPMSGDPFDLAHYAQREAQDIVDRNQVISDKVTGTPLRPTRDWYPVTYAPYIVDRNTFLINGHAFPMTTPVFTPDGGVLRMRIIDAGDEVHSLHLHGHHMLVTHKDGVLLDHPYWADTLLIGPGERYDVYVRGDNPGTWMLHDHMGDNEQNDHIHPGGMMTMLVYDSLKDEVVAHQHGSRAEAAGLNPWQHSGAYLQG